MDFKRIAAEQREELEDADARTVYIPREALPAATSALLISPFAG